MTEPEQRNTAAARKAQRALRSLLRPGEEIVVALDMWPYRSVRSSVARFLRGPVPDLGAAGFALVGWLGRKAKGRANSTKGFEIELRRGPATVVATTERMIVFELSSAGRFEGVIVDEALSDVELTYREPWHKWEPRQFHFQFEDGRTWRAQPELTSDREAVAVLEVELDAKEIPRRSGHSTTDPRSM